MRLFLLPLMAAMLSACSHLAEFDAQLYGSPPAELVKDVTVYVAFDDPVAVSVRCGQSAFGAIGSMVPNHGCVTATPGKPVLMITPTNTELKGKTRIVEFVSEDKAQTLCETYGINDKKFGLPEGGCMYQANLEETLRVVWPNPCEAGDAYMCHELGHVNQYSMGWHSATLSPISHWGKRPDQPEFLLASASTTSPAENAATRHEKLAMQQSRTNFAALDAKPVKTEFKRIAFGQSENKSTEPLLRGATILALKSDMLQASHDLPVTLTRMASAPSNVALSGHAAVTKAIASNL